MRLTWLADVLRAGGLHVVERPGWQRMGRELSRVNGIVWHHTASGPRSSDAAVADLLANGRPDLPGPLCQLGLTRAGAYVVIAAGRGNHNGFGTWGNDSIGIEAYNDGVGERWPVEQIEAYDRGTAVLLDRLGLTAASVKGHKETDPRRKIDPAGIDMGLARGRIAELLRTGAASQPAPPEPEDDDMGTYVQASDGNRAIFHFYGERVRQLTGAQFNRRRDLADLAGRPIQLQQMTGAQIMRYCADYQFISDPATR